MINKRKWIYTLCIVLISWVSIPIYDLSLRYALIDNNKDKLSTHSIQKEKAVPLKNKQVKISNINLDYAGLIIGSMALSLLTVLIFRLKGLEKIETYKKDIDICKTKITDLENALKNEREKINNTLLDFENTNEKNVYVIEYSLSKLIQTLLDSKLIGKDYYTSFSLSLARYKIKSKNMDTVSQAIMAMHARGGDDEIESLRKVIKDPQLPTDLKNDALTALEEVLKRVNKKD